jgi:hypothetical protein
VKSKSVAINQNRAVLNGVTKSSRDIGTLVRHLHDDYKQALAMIMAGKTDAEIVTALDIDWVDEAELQRQKEWMLFHLGVDSFDHPALRSRPVRRALKKYWIYEYE